MGENRTLEEANRLIEAEIERQRQMLSQGEAECDEWEEKLDSLETQIDEIRLQMDDLLSGAALASRTAESMRVLYEKLSAMILPYEASGQTQEAKDGNSEEIYKRVERKLNGCAIDTVLKEISAFNPEKLVENVDSLERDMTRINASKK